MKRYLLKILLFAVIPVLILTAIYFITDPFCVMKPFSLKYFDEKNRDYTSVELFMMNKDSHHYNSFIFGSCGLGGINSYHWQSKLKEGDKQYVFQSWGETLTGIEDKIVWLHKHDMPIDNAMIMIDIPSTFSPDQLSTDAVLMHDPKMSRMAKYKWHWSLYFNFLQKPSFWVESIKKWYRSEVNGVILEPSFDVVTNDQFARSDFNYSEMPIQDSMQKATPRQLDVLQYFMEHTEGEKQKVSESLINGEYAEQLRHIKQIFDECRTNYRVFVKPSIIYVSERINDEDLSLLKEIFGNEYVFDYSSDNEISRDLNHFRETAHFGLSAGWLMIEEMYGGRNVERY